MFFLFDAINEITSNAVSHLHYLPGFGGRAWQQRLDSKHGRSANPCHQEARNLHLAGSLCLNRRAWQSLSTPTLDSRQPLCLQYPPKGRGVRDCHRPCVSILITPRLPRGVVSETATAPVFHYYYYCLDLAMINPYSSETGGFSFS